MILKTLKDTFLIAGALILVIILLFLSSALTGVGSVDNSKITGDAVLNTGSTFGLQLFFFVLIILMLYLIYRALKLPGAYKSVPRPSGLNTIPMPTKIIVPKPIRPLVREVVKPVREIYQETVKAERTIEKEINEELDYIRNLLGKGRHETARSRYKGLER